jgi:streptogramin lyase
VALSFCPPQRLYVIFLSALCLSIVGCAANAPLTGSLGGGELRGSIHGGQQPVSGASVQIYAAGITGYGSAATPLLPSAVTTDANGAFTIPANYTCPSSTSQLYIVATGGNPGLTTGTDNPALAEMAALGPCSLHDGQYTLDPDSFIFINEATTVASVYALSAFIGGNATHVGTSSTNATGLANAFQMVNNLVNTMTGEALLTTPAGNGTSPQTTVDTLANILSACVNSDGTGTPCSGLFAAATPSAGTALTNTIEAIYDIARNPANNVSTLYGLPNASPPFQPALTQAPNDWVLAVTYTANGLQANTMAIDAGGNVWFTNNVYGSPASVTELSSNGAVLSGSSGYSGGGLSAPTGVAIDPSGNAWVSSRSNVVEFSGSGSILSGTSGYTGGGLTTPSAIAVDGQGNAWVTDSGSQSVIEMDSGGNILSGTNGFKTGTSSGPLGIAIDTSGDAWVPNTDEEVTEFDKNGNVLSGNGYAVTGLIPTAIAFDLHGNAWVNTQFVDSGLNLNNVGKLSSTGTDLSPANGYPNCVPGRYLYGLYANCLWYGADAFALDGAGNVWSNSVWSTGPGQVEYFASSVAEMSNTGTILSGANGLTGSTVLSSPGTGGEVASVHAFAIDAGGNVWVLFGYGTPAEFVGAATPVVTPFSVGAKNGTLGSRP